MTEPQNKESLKQTFFDLVDKHFPKGECQERAQALVLVVEALMAVETHDREIRLDEAKRRVYKFTWGESSAAFDEGRAYEQFKAGQRVAELSSTSNLNQRRKYE